MQVSENSASIPLSPSVSQDGQKSSPEPEGRFNNAHSFQPVDLSPRRVWLPIPKFSSPFFSFLCRSENPQSLSSQHSLTTALPASEKESALPTEIPTPSEISSELDESEINGTWRDVEDVLGADEDAPLVKDFIQQPSQTEEIEKVTPEDSAHQLLSIDPWEGLTETEKINFQKEISSGKLISKLGSPQMDTDGVRSLPECRFYQLIDIPTKNAAAVFWDAEALHPTAPNRIKTSEIKNLNNTTVEAVFQTSVGVWGMSDDISKVTITVEPVAHDGYLFTWSLSPGNQDRAYTKASNGSLLLLPHEGKTLVVYKAISTLKSNTFYNMAAGRIEGIIKETVQGIVKAIAQGQEQPQKLQGQVSVLEAACG